MKFVVKEADLRAPVKLCLHDYISSSRERATENGTKSRKLEVLKRDENDNAC